MTAHHADEAIRALMRDVAIATVEACADRLREPPRFSIGSGYAEDLQGDKQQIAETIADVFLECADEDAGSAVHAVRALAPSR